ncbi:phospholipase D-like domain-containing protein [Paenibacillus flagellatus]|uniref:phospholipase D-like domain-containing protein n=1 Tax=Paenibacillus flagellatus TaxID=2211139 RepID=UPI001305435D|nr:phospholipase D-like domain-containing protein [Paenibacillus flagellatus]
MKTALSFSGGTFVSTKDELGYGEVLEDFKNAKTIRIVTFNLSKDTKDDQLFERLQALESDVDIQLITNIPSRFEWYSSSKTGEYLKKTAGTNINAYLKKLNPDDFNANMIPFFNFNNHAKIVGTENIVYIGSANFSNESSKNYETGIIVKDKDFITNLYKLFFNVLKDNSIPYFKDDYNQLRLFTISILSRLNNHYERIIDTLFLRRDGVEFFIGQETRFTKDDQWELLHDLHELSGITGLIDNIENDDNELEEIIEKISDLCYKIDPDNIIDLIGVDSTFDQYVSYDFENTYWDCFAEYNSLATEDMLEHYTEIATGEANEILEDLCNEVENDVYAIKISLESTIEILKEILLSLKELSLHVVNEDIDNTRT